MGEGTTTARRRTGGRRSITAIAVLAMIAALFATAPVASAQEAEGGKPPPPKQEWEPGEPSNSRRLCVGVRGNGPRLWAHFGALARIAEQYGPITCAAGGSSGSITAFFIESIEINPAIDTCGDDQDCNNRGRRNREALLYKSVTGLPDVGLGGDIQQLVELGNALAAADVLALLEGPTPQEGVDALQRVLADVVPLFNQEIAELLAQSPDPVFHARDIVESVIGALDFALDDPVPFVRPGIVNFDQLSNILGRMASFYSGYGPFDGPGVDAWLDACAEASRGLTWEETVGLPGTKGRTCGQEFADLYNAYRVDFDATSPTSRIDDPIGQYRRILAVTGVLTGDAVGQWETARDQYYAAETVEFTPDFDDVQIGYWGRDRDLRRIERRLDRDFPGLQTDQFVALGQSSWREVLSASPAEPGLSAGVPLRTGEISVGGWADPLRVQVLEAMGARRTISVNRLGGVGGFTSGVAQLLGASDAEVDALFGFENSDFRVALDNATGMWCTDWDAPDTFDVAGLFADGYNAPFETDDPFFLRNRLVYENVTPNANLAGCTPGVLPSPELAEVMSGAAVR
ncbi:MAG: hypothetical protein AAF548_14755 [Actinomycetota bacterium]